MFEAGLFVETFLPLFILSAYKNSVHCKSIVILVNNRYGTRSIYIKIKKPLSAELIMYYEDFMKYYPKHNKA